MTLTIYGCHGSDVWLETDGDLYALTANDLAAMRYEVAANATGTTARFGRAFDESDVTALIQALTGPQLDDCACGGPGLVDLEGRPSCPGCLAGFGAREEGL